MPVFFNHAEEKLVEHLEMLYAKRQDYKMAVFVNSKMNREFSEQLYAKESSMLFVDVSSETDMFIFRCNDNEVVFLFIQPTAYTMARLKKLMRDIFTHIPENDVDFNSAFTLYELRSEFNEAMEFAYEKLRLEKYRAQFRNGPQETVIAPWYEESFHLALTKRSMRKQPLIALIEDETTTRHMAATILRQKYETVITADNGGSALELYNQHAPNLMFLDIDMPVLNGIDVLKRVIEIDKNSAIIMFTTHNSSEQIKSVLQIGAKGYVVKPFNAATLIKQAEHVLSLAKK